MLFLRLLCIQVLSSSGPNPGYNPNATSHPPLAFQMWYKSNFSCLDHKPIKRYMSYLWYQSQQKLLNIFPWAWHYEYELWVVYLFSQWRILNDIMFCMISRCQVIQFAIRPNSTQNQWSEINDHSLKVKIRGAKNTFACMIRFILERW